MGPQLYRCGNEMAHPETAPNVLRFNGAATLSLRKSTPWHDRNEAQFELQWGRNFIVAEIACHVCQDVLRSEASMGPQLYRCGNALTDGTTTGNIELLQWGRNFIVAEIVAR